MTKDEAINKLIRIRQVQGPRSEAHEALGMAIDALSQPSLPECLNEAAESFIKEIDEKYGLWPGFKLLFKQAITFGAKWMAGQIRKKEDKSKNKDWHEENASHGAFAFTQDEIDFYFRKKED